MRAVIVALRHSIVASSLTSYWHPSGAKTMCAEAHTQLLQTVSAKHSIH